MTYEELLNNISKSNYKSSNFRKIVNQFAYADMQDQHWFCDQLNDFKREYRAEGIVTKGYRFNYNGKYKVLTIYTKTPKYRTYKQQWVITAKRLEKAMKEDLEYKDFIARTKAKEVDNIHGCSLFFKDGELIGDII